MQSGGGGRMQLLLGGLAAAGVLFAHGAAYLVAVPSSSARTRVLESTGHGSRIFLIALVLGVLVAGLARFAVGFSARTFPLEGRGLFVFAAARLAVLQVAGFIGLEFAERWLASADLGHTLLEPAVVLGLILQILAALAGAALVVLLAAAIRRLMRPRPMAATRASDSRRPPCRISVPAVGVASGGATLRGPPSPERPN